MYNYITSSSSHVFFFYVKYSSGFLFILFKLSFRLQYYVIDYSITYNIKHYKENIRTPDPPSTKAIKLFIYKKYYTPGYTLILSTVRIITLIYCVYANIIL